MSDHKIKNREALLSHGDAGAKAQVLELTERVLQRLDARKRLHEMMHREGSELVIGSRRHDLSRYRHVYAFSSGKAGNHMARAFEDLLGEYLTLGVTIIKIRDEEDVYRKTEVYVGGHPLPNEEGIRGCQRMIDIAEQMGPDDLLLLGLTGGLPGGGNHAGGSAGGHGCDAESRDVGHGHQRHPGASVPHEPGTAGAAHPRGQDPLL
jgi:glycerate 2-kinase